MRKLHYPAFIDKEEDSEFGVSFPDFPGCVSAGETVEEALAGHLALMLADGQELPKAARALLISHWEVDSVATVKLVTGAMRRLAADKSMGRAEAMRQSISAVR